MSSETDKLFKAYIKAFCSQVFLTTINETSFAMSTNWHSTNTSITSTKQQSEEGQLYPV